MANQPSRLLARVMSCELRIGLAREGRSKPSHVSRTSIHPAARSRIPLAAGQHCSRRFRMSAAFWFGPTPPNQGWPSIAIISGPMPHVASGGRHPPAYPHRFVVSGAVTIGFDRAVCFRSAPRTRPSSGHQDSASVGRRRMQGQHGWNEPARERVRRCYPDTEAGNLSYCW